MKLLFDENLSPKLPQMLTGLFPGSIHLRHCNLKGAADDEVWEYARDNGFIVVSKDSDFYQRILLYGAPPKLVWLRIGNCSRDDVIKLLITHEQKIRSLALDATEAVLVLL